MHKVQGLILSQTVVSFSLEKQKTFKPGQMYIALSRIRNLQQLFLTGIFCKEAIKSSAEASKEYDRLLNTGAFILAPVVAPSYNSLFFTLINTRSLKSHASDIASDPSLMKNDILFLTETQFCSASDITSIESVLYEFSVECNMNNYCFSSLAICYQGSIKICDHQKFDGISIVKVHKSTFSDKTIGIALLYRKHSSTLSYFYEALTILNDHEDISIILGDFNLDLLDSDVPEQFINTLNNFQLLSHNITHLNGTHIYQIYIQKGFFS